MVCPLYKFLKTNGTSFYAFPGAAEDISAAYQNSNYKMYFSKYVLLDFPIQNTSSPGGTQSERITWDFTTTFNSSSLTVAETFKDQVIESLRNYVANHEITIRESRLNNTEYYYDNTALETTAEKIFWKWCRKLGLIEFEPALPQDEYIDTLEEFSRNSVTDDTYFREYLWRERQTNQYVFIQFGDYTATIDGQLVSIGDQALALTFQSETGFQPGDTIILDGDITNQDLLDALFGVGVYTEWPGPIQVTVLEITDGGCCGNQLVVIDFPFGGSSASPGGLSYGNLVYHPLVKYIGEVNGISNVQEANKAYTEVYAHIPDHTGRTPDILFRTLADNNYTPGMSFPIIPSQYQPEILGSELFSSPIVNTPQNYPGSYYGQFDTEDFTYETSNGDSLRRSGDFYGVSGDINTPIVDGSNVDGVVIDLDTTHYVKMTLPDRQLSNFDQFNGLEVNNQPPQDFEFNAILWYYTVEDQNGTKKTNLYGISFLDNPDNNPREAEIGIRFPTYRKLVANGNQDGTSYAFALNLNFNIINDNPVEAYNPESVNSLFSMTLFNEAMKRLASVNDSFLNIISEHSSLKDQILSVKQLIYSQRDFATINSKISNLEELLRSYSTMQSFSSNTIEVELVSETSPPFIRYNSIDRRYFKIENYNTSDMYNADGAVPVSVTVPRYKDFSVNIINNDEVSLILPNDGKLKLLMTSDLEFRQSVDIIITGSDLSTQNKKLDIFISTINPLGLGSTNDPTAISTTSTAFLDSGVGSAPESIATGALNTSLIETLVVSDIDLPVFYNSITSQPNSAKTWKNFKFNVDFTKDITVTSNNLLELSFDTDANIVYNSIKQGDVFTLNNLFVGTSSVFDFSGQYSVTSVSATSSTITLDVSVNSDFMDYVTGQLPLTLHTTGSSILSNLPYLDINKGLMIRITRVNELEQIPISEKYQIDVRDIQY
jgi:hypothetical protein